MRNQGVAIPARCGTGSPPQPRRTGAARYRYRSSLGTFGIVLVIRCIVPKNL